MWSNEVRKHQRRLSLLLSARIPVGQSEDGLQRYA